MNQINFLRYCFLSIILVTGISYSTYATHLRAGEITVTRMCSSTSLTFRITVTVFTNTINTTVEFGGDDDWLDFGDGTRMLIPVTKNIPRPDLGEGIATASFTIDHIYSGNGSYVISYSEPNRNEGVVNMDQSVNTRFYIESRIIADPFLGCNDTPRLLVPPIDRACKGVAWFHNAGAYDPDGDSLSYQLVIPFRDNNTTVLNYKDPSDPKFFSNYSAANETGTGPPTFSINPIDGTLTWDAPGTVGEYNIAFIIREWRKVNGVWVSGGFVRRDMQIIVDDCDNERPELEVPEDVCVEAGTTLDATIFGTDVDGDSVKIEAFSEIFNFPDSESPATYTPFPPDFKKQPAQLNFQWNTDCSHVKDQPYQVVFKITDRSPTGSSLVTFKTWFIKVVGPPPIWTTATTNLTNRSANLQWEPYLCQNAETIQVWRRVDSYAFEPDSCQTGMPADLGYTLIATLPVKDEGTATPTTTFTDTNGGEGLASGAQYCYRLVAVYPLPRGGESYVSKEICLDPILADKPIITNVTVDVTHSSTGQITVKWVAPFEADPVQFPPPYQYRVFRANGFSGEEGLTERTATNGLTFTDTGLNTELNKYNYRILAIASNGTPLDTSSTASSVRVEADSQVKKIQLTWRADVPWSNQIETHPWHRIYRGLEGDAPNELQLIDSVHVVSSGFIYVDEGQSDNTPLNDNTVYCYRIETRGAYGNPQIPEPLINFSQIICAQPGDTIPPCLPEPPIADKPQDCAAYIADINSCNNNLFENVISWTRPDDVECGSDISYYKVWVSAASDSKYIELPGEIRDDQFTDTNLPSYARCYRIQAVDRSGNRSELSEPICFDNCPYYELPNMFSPNGDGCNDTFSAYSDRNTSDETVDGRCDVTPEESLAKCARFVEKVNIRIFNRWGKEVYSYESGGERTIYIDWKGRGEDGGELSTGVYYYVAEVTFDSVDPAKRNQIIKGWVQLMR